MSGQVFAAATRRQRRVADQVRDGRRTEPSVFHELFDHAPTKLRHGVESAFGDEVPRRLQIGTDRLKSVPEPEQDESETAGASGFGMIDLT